MSDNDDLELEDVLDDDADDQDTDADSDNDQGPDGDQGDDNKDKRIKDLMSKWQQAEARANKAEAAQKGKDASGAGDAAAAGDGNSEVQQWIEAAKGQARDQIYASDPRFAEFGLDRSSITGSTPAEMQDAARKLSAVLDKVENGMRDSILKKHGLSPEVRSAPAGKTRSWDSMSTEDYEKEVAKLKSAW